MRKYSTIVVMLFIISLLNTGCKKDDNPVDNVATYPVELTILNPAGLPQGGALVSLVNPPQSGDSYSGYTDSSGTVTLKAPEGAQVFLAKMGSALTVEIPFTVKATNDVTQNRPAPKQLQQNGTVKILVVKASAEEIENVLRDSKINFNTFTETDIDTLRDWANTDSVGLYNYLKTFSLIFSDCHAGSEGNDDYALLSRTYGRYVQNGGKMYGGHYNYYHLQRIWPGYYQTRNYYEAGTDSISIINADLSNYLGITVAEWHSSDGRNLSGYEKFDDLPTNAKIYGIINGSSPAVGVIVENYIGTGKYLWTDYHNQDIKNDALLIKLVQYFLYSL